jgi:putative membrane protein
MRRKPRAFPLEQATVTLAPEDAAPLHAPAERLISDERELATALVPQTPAQSRRKPIRWGLVFWSSFTALVLLGLGLTTVGLVEDLFARATWLGWAGTVLAAIMTFALLVIAVREVVGVLRLDKIEHLRLRAEEASAADDGPRARRLVRDLVAVNRRNARLARARAKVSDHLEDIIDGADLIRLAERELMAPLDADARELVTAAASRVSVVTAVSPRAALDMIFVFFTALILLRRLADLYGGRPGAIGLMRLLRQTIAHLAITGGMAAGDSVIQQILGHSVAAKLSARLGEGMLNGLLTARLGLAAIDIVRPLPFAALPRPALGDLVAGLLRRAENLKDRPD